MNSTLRVTVLAVAICATGAALGQSGTTWGPVKEGIRIGLRHIPGSPLSNGEVLVYYGWTTNYLRNFVLPADPHQTLSITLKRSADGSPIRATPAGARYAAKLQTRIPRWRRVAGELTATLIEPEQIAHFDIDSCFAIAELGDYDLEVQVRLLREVAQRGPSHRQLFKRDDVVLAPVLFDAVAIRLRLHANPAGTSESPP